VRRHQVPFLVYLSGHRFDSRKFVFRGTAMLYVECKDTKTVYVLYENQIVKLSIQFPF
jgi:hypothetical protein